MSILMSKLEERLMYMPLGYQTVYLLTSCPPWEDSHAGGLASDLSRRPPPGCSLTLCPQWRLAAPYYSCELTSNRPAAAARAPDVATLQPKHLLA